MDRGRCTNADVDLMWRNARAARKAAHLAYVADRPNREAKEQEQAIAEAARQKARYERQKARDIIEQD